MGNVEQFCFVIIGQVTSLEPSPVSTIALIHLLEPTAVILHLAALGTALAALALAWRSRRTIHLLLRERHQQAATNRELWHSLFELRRIVAPLHCQSRTDGSDPIQSWSQHGEDLILFDLFQQSDRGTFVDVGAYDGLRLSNTAFFERLGWTGVLIEAHPELAQACRQNRPGSKVVHAAAGSGSGPDTISFSMVDGPVGVDTLSFSGDDPEHLRRIASEGGTVRNVTVPLLPLDTILADAAIESIDLVSIDVEGAEDQVLDGFDLARWKPKAILLESNNAEASRRAEQRLGKAGYERLRCIGANDLFVRRGAFPSVHQKESTNSKDG